MACLDETGVPCHRSDWVFQPQEAGDHLETAAPAPKNMSCSSARRASSAPKSSFDATSLEPGCPSSEENG